MLRLAALSQENDVGKGKATSASVSWSATRSVLRGRRSRFGKASILAGKAPRAVERYAPGFVVVAKATTHKGLWRSLGTNPVWINSCGAWRNAPRRWARVLTGTRLRYFLAFLTAT